MRLVTRFASVGIVVGVLIGMNGQDSLAWRPYDRALQKKVADDPLVKKYVKVTPLSSGHYGWHSQFKSGTLNQMTAKCRSGFFKCPQGWKFFRGRGDAAQKQFFADALKLGHWGKSGRWVFKLNTGFPRSGFLAVEAIALTKHPQAVDLLAKTIDSESKLSYLLCSSKYRPYEALWRLGGKSKLDIMIKGMANHRCKTWHVRALLSRLDAWKLSGAQKKKVEDLCVETILPSSDSRLQASVWACAQWLGRVGTKSADAKEFLMKLTGRGGRPEAYAARRALGNLKHRGARKLFKSKLKASFRKRQRSVRVGRRIKRFKIKTWAEDQTNISMGVALATMGDSYAKKALRYWVGFLRDGSFNNSGAYTHAFNEAAFATPKGYKKVRSILVKAFKKGVKLLRKHPRHSRYVTQAAINLMQQGDTAALKHVMKVLKGNDRHEVREILQACGAKLGLDPGGKWGPRHLRVGKGGLSVKNAQKLVKLIRRQFKFWSDRYAKEWAILAVLEIEARIIAVKKRL